MVQTICDCGRTGIVKTSWTSTNPGRRFYCCTRRSGDCGFIDWYDPPMCERAVQIIPGLLRSKNALEDAMNAKTRAIRNLQMYLALSWIVFGLYVFYFKK